MGHLAGLTQPNQVNRALHLVILGCYHQVIPVSMSAHLQASEWTNMTFRSLDRLRGLGPLS